jgi:hypothetical protein
MADLNASRSAASRSTGWIAATRNAQPAGGHSTSSRLPSQFSGRSMRWLRNDVMRTGSALDA